jgi:hypothetical protein
MTSAPSDSSLCASSSDCLRGRVMTIRRPLSRAHSPILNSSNNSWHQVKAGSQRANTPTRVRSRGSPLTWLRTIRLPLTSATRPSSSRVSPESPDSIRACAAIGTAQPPPNDRSTARSASVASIVGRCSSPIVRSWMRVSPALASMPRAPCPPPEAALRFR